MCHIFINDKILSNSYSPTISEIFKYSNSDFYSEGYLQHRVFSAEY